jgi:hypothetical protein
MVEAVTGFRRHLAVLGAVGAGQRSDGRR